MESGQKGIFNFTEITTLETEKALLLPQLTKTPRTAASLNKPSSSSKPNTISSLTNFSSKPLATPKTSNTETLELLKNRVLQDLKSSSSRPRSHIFSWDIDTNLKPEVSAIQKIISLKQEKYNKIHHEAEKKEEMLKRLKFELSSLQNDQITEVKALLNKRYIEKSEIQNALDNENYYIETLKHMLNDRKKIVITAEPPVLHKKSQVLERKREIAELKNILEGLDTETIDLDKASKAMEQEILTYESRKEAAYQQNFTELKKKLMMGTILETEFNLNADIQSKKQLLEQIKRKISELQKAESDENILARYADKLKVKESYEKKISLLKGVAFTNSFEEIYENYEILKEHTEMLELAAIHSLNRIDALSSERNRLATELNEIILNHEDERKVNYREFDRIKQNLKEKNKLMDENEKFLANLSSVMGSICGSVTKLSSQLLGSAIIDVKPRNIVKYFTKCIARLEEKLNFIMADKLNNSEKLEGNDRLTSLVMMHNRRYSSSSDVDSEN